MGMVLAIKYLGFNEAQQRHLGFTAERGITAAGNASQANAYQLTADINGVAVVTPTNNSVKVPKAESHAYGQVFVRNNDAADSLNVYPYDGDEFGVLGMNIPIALAPGESLLLWKMAATAWLQMKGT